MQPLFTNFSRNFEIMKNIEQIIAKCQKNDRKAQKRLYEMYAPLLLGICMRYAKDKQEAEDVLQEGFIKIFSRIEQYSGKGSFDGWLKRIIVNTAITNYRANLKRYYHDEISDVSEYNFIGDVNESEFTREELLKAIRQLPKGYAIVFNLYAIEGYKHREISEMLDVDISTSKSQFLRARNNLQKILLELKKEKVSA